MRKPVYDALNDWLTVRAEPPHEDEALVAYRARLGPEDAQARLLMADLARLAGMFSTSHIPGDAHTTAFQEGRRSLFLDILRRAHADP
jgi:hypothetical protein